MTAGAALHRTTRQAKNFLKGVLQLDERRRFRGSYANHAEAIAAVKSDHLIGYDNDEIAEISYEAMCQVHVWDYPIIFWLVRILAGQSRLIDAGGHMGTKFRAFLPYLDLPDDFEWAILDVPAICEAGRKRAQLEGLRTLSFFDSEEDLPESEILLTSGLFQYIDSSPSELIARLKQRPRHLLINKVATREEANVVTLERFPGTEIPYQVRNRAEFEQDLQAAGYSIRDQWDIPSYSRYHKAFGHAVSRGYYATLDA